MVAAVGGSVDFVGESYTAAGSWCLRVWRLSWVLYFYFLEVVALQGAGVARGGYHSGGVWRERGVF